MYGIVFEVVKVIALAHLVGDEMNLDLLKGGVAREFGWVSLTQICED
jgi:hypothetical protein